jgi:hypothetical protein
MDKLDLDINNYSLKDIERFFQLKPNSKYNASDIELKEAQIREQLLNSGHINKRIRRDLINFLLLAKQWLIFVKCNNGEVKPPTTIPKNYKLDPLDLPMSKEPNPRTDELINRPTTQFIYSNSSEFFPGVINPLNTRIITKCLNIDTRFRDNLYNTQSSDFTLQLPTKFNKVVSMALSAVEFPVAFYGISATNGNNYLNMRVIYCFNDLTNRILKHDCVFIIPDGSYTPNDLIDTINFVINKKTIGKTSNDPDYVFNFIKVEVDITPNGSGTRRVTIANNDSKDVTIKQIILDFTKNIEGLPDTTNIFTKIGWNLGFTKPKYCGDTFYVAETVIEPTTKYIYLAIDDFNNHANNHFVTAFNKSILSTDVIGRISIKGSYINSIIENDFNLVTEPRLYFGPVDIQRLRVRLFDEFGRILSMNNSNYSFCLTMKLLYDL